MRKTNRTSEALELYKYWIKRGVYTGGLLGNAINAAIDTSEVNLAKQWIKMGKETGNNVYKYELAECRLIEESGEEDMALMLVDKCIENEEYRNTSSRRGYVC